jgi:hypothetical protein
MQQAEMVDRESIHGQMVLLALPILEMAVAEEVVVTLPILRVVV